MVRIVSFHRNRQREAAETGQSWLLNTQRLPRGLWVSYSALEGMKENFRYLFGTYQRSFRCSTTYFYICVRGSLLTGHCSLSHA